jgi:hypothetical protein
VPRRVVTTALPRAHASWITIGRTSYHSLGSTRHAAPAHARS